MAFDCCGTKRKVVAAMVSVGALPKTWLYAAQGGMTARGRHRSALALIGRWCSARIR